MRDRYKTIDREIRKLIVDLSSIERPNQRQLAALSYVNEALKWMMRAEDQAARAEMDRAL